jgi:hypothetical protein
VIGGCVHRHIAFSVYKHSKLQHACIAWLLTFQELHFAGEFPLDVGCRSRPI